jgi:predicted enzyme related to lactoylglutathione lyase
MDHNPVGWFEIPVLDMKRARKFYEDVLGRKTEKLDFPGYEFYVFPMEEKAKGIGGALVGGKPYAPSEDGTVIYFTCPDIDGTLLKVEKAGGKVILPKKQIGEWGFISWIADSEGNTIGLHSVKK